MTTRRDFLKTLAALSACAIAPFPALDRSPLLVPLYTNQLAFQDNLFAELIEIDHSENDWLLTVSQVDAWFRLYTDLPDHKLTIGGVTLLQLCSPPNCTVQWHAPLCGGIRVKPADLLAIAKPFPHSQPW